jgi:hypothetical protein
MVESIWMGIAPGPRHARVIAMTGPGETILKARLASNPSHPRAVPALLEAIALWHGRKVRAALCADESHDSYVTSLYPDLFRDPADTPLYGLEWVPVARRARRHRGVSGMGDFRDLERLVIYEVAR